MTCDEVDELLLDFAEGTLDERQRRRVDEHLGGCARCRSAAEGMRQLVDALSQVRAGGVHSGPMLDARSGFATANLARLGSGARLGDFEILEEIGRGGMGVVYRARQVSLNRMVALKVLSGVLCQSDAAVERFRNEAQAAAKLHHTNIVPVYAQGDQDGLLYYAMELVDGKSLDRVLKEDRAEVFGPGRRGSSAASAPGHPDKPAPPARSASASTTAAGGQRANYRYMARLVAGVAEGLDHAHRHGVIHRDIKPQNLMLAADRQLHITDFGLARILDQPGMTITGEMLGTPAYMSPEQVTADRRKIDHRTDIYSLGVTFYEMLSGRKPFEAATREQLVRRICEWEPVPPRKIDAHVPVDLETICLRAMEKQPGRRYQTAAELAADLRRYVENRPIAARRVSRLEKAVKWVRRHPALTTIGVLVLLLAFAGLWVVRERHRRANDLVAQAFDSVAYGDYREPEEARAKLAVAQRLGPAETAFRKARALAFLQEKTLDAIADLQGVLDRDPHDREAAYLLAWALHRNGQYEAARSRVAEADAHGGPPTAAAWFFRGQTHHRMNPQESFDDYRRATELRKDYVQAMLHLGRSYNQWMYLNRKHEYFGEGKRYLELACTLQPNKAYPLYLLSTAYCISAEIYLQTGREKDAEEHFRSALDAALLAQKVEPGKPPGFIGEAQLWESRRDYARAIAARDRSSEVPCRREELQNLYMYRWRLLYWTGNLTRAARDLEDLLTVFPREDPRITWFEHLCPALLEAERGRPERARALVDQMITDDPRNCRAVTSGACLLRVLGDAKAADELLARSAAQVELRPPPVSGASVEWARAAYDFCRRPEDLDQLPSTPTAGRERQVLLAPCLFFKACHELGLGSRQSALQLFRACEATYDNEDYCYLGTLFARKLELQPDWPAWLLPAAPH